MARSSTVTGSLRLRSTFTEITSRFELSNSSQAPRLGMILAKQSRRSVTRSSSIVK